jgi:hypothetical protein
MKLMFKGFGFKLCWLRFLESIGFWHLGLEFCHFNVLVLGTTLNQQFANYA